MARKSARKNQILAPVPEGTEPRLTSEVQSSPTAGTPGSAASAQAASTDSRAPTQSDLTATAASRPKPSSKLGIMLGLLEAAEGATLNKLVEVTGWLPHTTRAALTGLRKRGYAVTSEKQLQPDGRNLSVYRIGTRTAD